MKATLSWSEHGFKGLLLKACGAGQSIVSEVHSHSKILEREEREVENNKNASLMTARENTFLITLHELLPWLNWYERDARGFFFLLLLWWFRSTDTVWFIREWKPSHLPVHTAPELWCAGLLSFMVLYVHKKTCGLYGTGEEWLSHVSRFLFLFFVFWLID